MAQREGLSLLAVTGWYLVMIQGVINKGTGRDGEAELAWVAGYIQRWLERPKAITFPVLTGSDVE